MTEVMTDALDCALGVLVMAVLGVLALVATCAIMMAVYAVAVRVARWVDRRSVMKRIRDRDERRQETDVKKG